jgi:hypothetical protein
MSNERDTDERIGDAAVTDAWRAASMEEPAPRMDAAILAAARAATATSVGPSPRGRGTRWWTGWQPLAAAGVAGLAFLLVQRLPDDTAERQTVEAPTRAEPAASVAPARAEPDAATGLSVTSEAPAAHPTAKRPGNEERGGTPPSEQAKGVMADRSEDLASAPAPTSQSRTARASTASIAASSPEVAMRVPEDWVRLIVDLREAGDLSAAADELRAFRNAYPDADSRLPAGLREWADSVVSGADR